MDINNAIKILSESGCKEIFLFGSLVNGNFTNKSDIDIAVNGIKANEYFKILGKLIFSLNNSVDLVDLDENSRFVKFLLKKEELIRVA
ncbi:MAG: hypothetical protein A2046_13505 [Bacteroidetes bacterium GWA2_30_7]|nr:MAG: hypothetical protein A2046_13505 [Bacteroidetes bacterium GWA2_30_7]